MIKMWIPEWLGIPYCILYTKYKDKGFSFEDAKRELGIPESNLLKVLSELGKHGFLFSRIENKSREYMLSDFDSIALGVKARKENKDLSIADKLKYAFKKYGKKYLITRSSAAFLYHAYQFPAKYEIEIFPRDYGFWHQFLDEAELIPKLDEKKFDERIETDGLFVSSPERIIVEGLKEGRITSTIDVASLIVSEKGQETLDWKKLENYAIRYNVVNELGAILEILDDELRKEYKRSLIPRKIINELFTHVKTIGRIREYPKATLREEETYLEIAKKWRLRLRLPSYAIEKPVQDLAAFALEVI